MIVLLEKRPHLVPSHSYRLSQDTRNRYPIERSHCRAFHGYISPSAQHIENTTFDLIVGFVLEPDAHGAGDAAERRVY